MDQGARRLDAISEHICAKDLGRLMNHYAADVVVFDVFPGLYSPLTREGR